MQLSRPSNLKNENSEVCYRTKCHKSGLARFFLFPTIYMISDYALNLTSFERFVFTTFTSNQITIVIFTNP